MGSSSITTPSASSTPAALSASDINTENGYAAAQTMTFDDAVVRTLAGAGGSGTTISMAMLRGKSSKILTTISSNQTNYTINVNNLSGYVAGKATIEITIPAGVYIYSTSTSNAGLTITGGTTGDTIKLINNGYIMGMGGNGGNGVNNGSSIFYPGGAGGSALSINYPITIDNTNPAAYIAGGGGGGGGGVTFAGGGGGAGGGAGGTYFEASSQSQVAGTGGAGGAIGVAGATGNTGGNRYISGVKGGGGGGGRILPGTGGAGGGPGAAGSGGEAGGGGGGDVIEPGGKGQVFNYSGGAGGGGNSAGVSNSAGGGGGWGAAGGTASVGGTTGSAAGGAGGKAVQLNSKTVTWISGNTTRVYGAVA